MIKNNISLLAAVLSLGNTLNECHGLHFTLILCVNNCFSS